MNFQNFKPVFAFILFAIFMIPAAVFAQEYPGIEETFATYAGLVAGVVALTGIYKKFISDKNTFLVSIILSILVSAAGWYFQIGIFIGLLWWHALLYSVGVVVIVKGTVSIELVIQMLGLIGIGPKKLK